MHQLAPGGRRRRKVWTRSNALGILDEFKLVKEITEFANADS